MLRYLFLISIIINQSFSQDTLNFRLFDSLKTAAENSHKPAKVYKDPDNFDVRMFRSINNNRSNFKDDVLPYTDRSAPLLTFFMPLGTFIYGRASKHYYDENTGYLLGLSEGLNLSLTFGMKYIIKRDRPYVLLHNVHFRENLGTDPYSFPSGHTSMTIALSVMYNLRYPKFPQVYVPMYLYSLIVAYGRPYFGMHYPSDLLGGAIVGAGSSILIFSLRDRLFTFKNRILSENMEDAGSINGNNAWIFGAAFIASSLLGDILLSENNKIKLNVSPFGRNNEILNINFNVKF